MMEFVATEAAFPALPSHLVAGSAYADLPAHPLGVRPLPSGARRLGHLHSHHGHGHGHSSDAHADDGDGEESLEDEESPEQDGEDEDEDQNEGAEEEEEEDDEEEEEEVEVDDECRKSGLGAFAELDDGTLFLILQQLPQEDLLTLSLVSRAFYAFAEDDQLWKNFVLHRGVGNCTCFSLEATTASQSPLPSAVRL